MNSKLTIRLTCAALLAAATITASAETTTYRDSMGRTQGSASTDRYGKTTYRDAQGRVQATETTDRYGKTTYRDSMGRVQGTKTVK